MLRVPIRVKLALASGVPLLGLLAFSAAEVRAAAADAGQVRAETELASAATGPAGVISRLQDERSWAVIEMTGLQSSYEVPVAGYEDTRAATDDAIEAFRADVESKGGAVAATYGSALDALDEVAWVRQDIDGAPGPRDLSNMPASVEAYDRYAQLIDGLLDANARVTSQVRDAELRQGTALADLASHQLELQADVLRQTAVAALLSPGGIDTPAEITRITRSLGAFDANNREIEQATGPYRAVIRDLYPRSLAERTHGSVRAAIERGTIDSLQSFLDDTTPPPDGGYFALRDAFVETLTRRADVLHARATDRQRLFTSLAVGAFLLVATMTWVVSRSITRPLRSLTRQATSLARQRLPGTLRHILDTPPGLDVDVPATVPVVVATRDEVADVASALNRVQDSAVALAVEQAVLRHNTADSIVSLGRRNQALLGRQLDFIGELGAGEADPGVRASLFRLSHLATRMRRSAESLLVLAGIATPARGSAPVPLIDVVRTAAGEVEHYQRLWVDITPATIAGPAAADLAHLLAELLENAVTFSPPEALVVLRGWWHGPDVLRLAVIDQGLGMPPAAIEQANRRLGGSDTFTVAPSRYLGHHVAGSLAARHGIRVRLDAVPARGIIAVVDVPAELAAPDAVPGAVPAVSLPSASG